ncbi:uncharacterized protein LOC141653199 [Silene latifolia]|uniref:uncharacterized protein LOC141653199 n=1 Tax=Silene latifolia TaxID=37657 RepID=UPI003D77D086
MAGARGRLFGGGGGGGAGFFSSSHLPQSFSLYGSSSSVLGSSSMVSFEDVCGGKRSERPFFCTYDQEENGDDDYDEYLHQPGKKRRLSIEQVHFLEKSFETDNKLEPDRKIQLAKELGLQPRQVAIWFQNRRARWKTKQMEKDFDKLQDNYNSLKSDYESLLEEKEKLKAEVVHLSNKLEQKEHENPASCNMSDQLKTLQQNPNIESASENEEQHPSIFSYSKHEDLSSAKSDVIDSDSSQYYVEAGHSSSYAEPGNSSYIFEADHSDISQDDEDYLNKSIMPSSHVFPKIEDVELPSNSGHLGLSGDDHTSLFWPYWDINLKMPSSLYM